MDKIEIIRNKHREICSKFEIVNFSIAGGFIRDTYSGDTPKDVDLFFQDEQSYKDSIEIMEYKAKKIKQRKNSVVFKTIEGEEIDLVYCNGKTVAETVFDFDLLSCCVFFNQIDGLISKEGWLNSCESKVLNLNIVRFPYLTLGRVAKFKKRGWEISNSDEINLLDYCYKASWGPSAELKYNF